MSSLQVTQAAWAPDSPAAPNRRLLSSTRQLHSEVDEKGWRRHERVDYERRRNERWRDDVLLADQHDWPFNAHDSGTALDGPNNSVSPSTPVDLARTRCSPSRSAAASSSTALAESTASRPAAHVTPSR